MTELSNTTRIKNLEETKHDLSRLASKYIHKCTPDSLRAAAIVIESMNKIDTTIEELRNSV